MRRCIALLLALAAWGAEAHAQEQGLPSEPVASAAASRADELIRLGVELRREGRESEAFARFREAHAIHPSPRALAQMGLAAKSIRLYVEAERCLEGALAASEDAWVKQNREALELARDIVARHLASLLVRSNVDGAELYVNGSPIGKLPLEQPVRVLAGAALLELRAPGHEPSATETTLPAGATTELRIELHAAKPLPAPMPSPKIDPTPTLPPPEEPASWTPWIFTSLGVGAIGVGIGTYFGVRTIMKKNERDEVCPANPCATDAGVELDRDARSSAIASTVSLSIGGAFLATSLILWLVEPKPAPRAAIGPSAYGARLRF